MKTGRNDPCPCGSGKKYKHCCIDVAGKQRAEVFDDIAEILAMNPHLTVDELNLVTQRRMAERNKRPKDDFCGLSPTQMSNWLYAPFDSLDGVTIETPADLSGSPVMRYLDLIIDEAMQQGGSFKATTKGNLPMKLVRQAADLLSEFAVAEYETDISISEFAGRNEDSFNALHYARVLAEMAGVIYRRSGRFHVKKAAQKQYQTHGISAFFLPVFEAAVTQYNWGYFDGWDDDIDLRMFWLFMLWRLQSHGSADQLTEEVRVAFPMLVSQIPVTAYSTPERQLGALIGSRFINRCLEFWGFVTFEPRWMTAKEDSPRPVTIQPLLNQTFTFSV